MGILACLCLLAFKFIWQSQSLTVHNSVTHASTEMLKTRPEGIPISDCDIGFSPTVPNSSSPGSAHLPPPSRSGGCAGDREGRRAPLRIPRDALRAGASAASVKTPVTRYPQLRFKDRLHGGCRSRPRRGAGSVSRSPSSSQYEPPPELPLPQGEEPDQAPLLPAGDGHGYGRAPGDLPNRHRSPRPASPHRSALRRG